MTDRKMPGWERRFWSLLSPETRKLVESDLRRREKQPDPNEDSLAYDNRDFRN